MSETSLQAISQSKGFRVVFFLLTIGVLFTANPVLTFASLSILYLIFSKLQRPLFPAILFFCMSYQWAQASIRIFQANLAGDKLNTFDSSNNASNAAVSALLAILLLTLITASFAKKSSFDYKIIIAHLHTYSIKKIFYSYLFFIFIASPILFLLKRGGLTQIVNSIDSFRWVIFVLLFATTLVQKKNAQYFTVVFLSEFLLGFTGYFSGFKTPIFFTLIAYLSFLPKISIRVWTIGLVTGISLLSTAIFWTSVKGDYRSFLNQGKTAQVVYVEESEAFQYLGQKIGTISTKELGESFDHLLSRMQYTQMIQRVFDYVPTYTEHEGGKIWAQAVLHVFTPRILFPNKPIIDDSVTANKYTGVKWAGIDQGTSISIGYIAEAYVDFGPLGMFIPIIILGLFVGYAHNSFIRNDRKFPAIEFATLIVFLIQFNKIETSANKLIGGMLMFLIVYAVIMRPFVFPVANKILKK